jgi:hypothetical protein
MSTRPPQPPPREPSFLPPPGPSPWRLVLKIALWMIAAMVLLFVVGVGLLAATCGGLLG